MAISPAPGRRPPGVREGVGTLGANLLRIRKAKGMTQAALGNAANVSPSHIQTIESGKVTNPGVFQVYRIALALRVPMEELMGVSELRTRDRISRRKPTPSN